MDQRAFQHQSQKQHLSPQLRQYLKFLYLPQMELRDALQHELSENPALEEISESPATEVERTEISEEKKEEPTFADVGADSFPEIDFARRNQREMQSIHEFQEASLSKPITLLEHLERQISFQTWTTAEMNIAKQIVGHLDSEGFLQTDLADIANTSLVSQAEIERILRLVQDLNPPGIAARSLQECLQIQIRRRYPKRPMIAKIVAENLSDIARRDAKSIAKKQAISIKEAEEAIHVITQLDPHPARDFRETRHQQIVPDAQIQFKGTSQNEFDIEIFKEHLPRFRLSPEYRRMLRDPKVDAATRNYLKIKINDGSQLMKALDLRESTLRRISQEIVKTQGEFFIHGFSHLKPLRLKDVADVLEMHPSTISRAIHEKYVMTPQGTLPFKSFFSQRVETAVGEDESQKSLLSRIQKMVENEKPAQPLSDQQIVEKLKSDNVNIARRTVAKYREMLRILPTHLRRKRM